MLWLLKTDMKYIIILFTYIIPFILNNTKVDESLLILSVWVQVELGLLYL